jgi:hypothetical protein
MLSGWNLLPYTEIWLSDDGQTWWNVAQIDGSTIRPDEPVALQIGYVARYVKLVVPYADQTGLSQFGGFRDIAVRPPVGANEANGIRPLTQSGTPVTPEPSEEPESPTTPGPTAVPTPEPPPEPTVAPTPEPTAIPTVEPTPSPAPTPTPVPEQPAVEPPSETEEPAPADEALVGVLAPRLWPHASTARTAVQTGVSDAA